MSDCRTAHDCHMTPPTLSELDLSAMRAVGLVLSGLVLQPKDMTGDIIDEKGKLFLK